VVLGAKILTKKHAISPKGASPTPMLFKPFGLFVKTAHQMISSDYIGFIAPKGN
jgi:hypothetical protein